MADGAQNEADDDLPIEDQTDDEIIADAKKFLEFVNTTDGDNRKQALDDLNFLAGDQWDATAKKQRDLDGRPCLTINKLPTFLHQVTNDQRQNVCSIKISPVDSGADVETAEIIQGLIRHAEYASNADIAYDTAVNCAAASGVGYFRLVTEYCKHDSFDQDIRWKRIRNPFTVYFDPASEEPDGSDACRVLISEKKAKSDFIREYPQAEVTTEGFATGIGNHADWIWEDFVRVAEFYRVEMIPDTVVELSDGTSGLKSDLEDLGGTVIVRSRPTFRKKVMWYKLTALEVLEKTEIKCNWIPVFPIYGDELDIDGKVIRAGVIRNAKDPARMYNYWMFLSLTTPIPTINGWSTVGALRVGDRIFADNGGLTNVIGKSNVAIGKECFEIEFDDGAKVVSSGDHPWTVQERGKRKAKGYDWTEKTIRTDELDPKQHAIKVCGQLDLPYADLPVSPYFLGYWLGDGNSAGGGITVGDLDVAEVTSLLHADGIEVGNVSKSHRANRFTALGEVGKLRQLGVLNNKRIPTLYLRASIAQRQSLLQGLMDTDGSIKSSGAQCVFTGSNTGLVDDVRELLHSLGIKTGRTRRAGRVSKMADGYEIVSGESEALSFAAPSFPIFKIARKLKAQRIDRVRHTRRTQQRKIISVTSVPSVPVQCIAIDAPSHLYLCGQSMIPTHNTAATEEVALRTKTPFIGAEGQFEGYEDEWNQANTRSFPYMEYKPVTLEGSLAPPPARQPMTDVPVGILRMAEHANDNIKATTGLFDSSLGARGSATSGKQEIAQQRQGDLANFHYTDNRNRSVRQAGRCFISMVPNYYDAKRVVRTMGEDGKLGFSEVNAPIPPEQQKPDPKTGAVQTILNDLTIGEYDITVSAGPSYDTLRQEAVEGMVSTAKAWPKLMDVAGDKVIRAMDWPDAEGIADRIAKTLPPGIADEEESDEPMVQTPRGPIPIDQAGQMLVEMDQQMQEMGQELSEAKSGIAKAKIDAQSRETVAEINAVSKADVAELQGAIQLLIAKMQPPPVLAGEVASDLEKDNGSGAPAASSQTAPAAQADAAPPSEAVQ